MKALSWRIYFPRYQPFDGKRDIVLNKLHQGCEAMGGATGGRIFQAAGIKDAFIKSYRTELHQTLTALSAPGQPLDPAIVASFVDQGVGGYIAAEAAESPAAKSGSYVGVCGGASGQAARLKTFAKDRHARVMQGAWP